MDAKADAIRQHAQAKVSIHAPVMDANINTISSIGFYSFNPRARDGRETSKICKSRDLQVSIHAPVMDANAIDLPIVRLTNVSIHAPVMDAK